MQHRHGVAYFGNRFLDHFQCDLAEMREHGFDTVVHCVSEQDLDWGMGRIAEMFAATKAAGMSCWADPWGVARVFGGEAHSGFLASGGRACLDEPAFIERMTEWTTAVVDAGAEMIFWDEPNLEKCGCCSGRMVEFLECFSNLAGARGVDSSVCLCSFERNVELFTALARLPHVVDIGTDPYYTMPLGEDYDPEAYNGRWAQVVRDAADAAGTSCHLWIQGFDLAADAEKVIPDVARIAREQGVHDLFFWGYRAAEVTSRIAPERPAEVWRLAGEVFGSRLAPVPR